MGIPITWDCKIPANMIEKIKELGREWNKSRPNFDPKIERDWDEVIDKWATESDMPLIIRKSSGARGSEVVHSSGRRIIISDNSPAQWVCYLALNGEVKSVSEIKQALLDDKVPISFAIKEEDKSKIIYRQTLSEYSINKLGWKLCHKDRVGIGNNEDPKTMNIDTVIDRFKKLMKPSNFFIIPKKLGGLGELDEFIKEIM